MPKTMNLAHKQKLAKKAKPFTLKEGIMYRMGQDNKMHRCLTTSKTQIVLKELHERMARRHFVADITAKKILNARYWRPTLFKDIHDFCKSCNNCQKIRGLKIESLAKLVTTLLEEPFTRWVEIS
jgi:hypothetical protein